MFRLRIPGHSAVSFQLLLRFLRIYLCSLPFLLLNCTFADRESANPSDWNLGISLEKRDFKPGESIALNIYTFNVSKTPQRLLLSHPLSIDYELLIYDQDGHPVPLSDAGKKRLDQDAYSQSLTVVEPGKSDRNTLFIDKLYQLHSSGLYSITVRQYLGGASSQHLRRLPPDRQKGIDLVSITSQTLLFRVEAIKE